MFSKILVPLDGSELAEETLCQAEELAKSHGGEIMLLRVANFHPFPGMDAREHEQKAIERAQAYLDKVAGRVQTKGIKVSTHVRVGEASGEILDHAKRYATAVVMATHGRGGMIRWAMGSVADRVIRRCTKPVLLVRSEQSCQAL